jgi:hypothetical protein
MIPDLKLSVQLWDDFLDHDCTQQYGAFHCLVVDSSDD